ncbi:hsp90 co-chaperone Cdc37, partial [Silurus asotus]
MTTIDYSVWDHIEVSDDEDDTHPNIDTPSLFRWRHQVTHTHTHTHLHHTIPPLPDAPHHTHTPPHYTPFTRCASPHTHSTTLYPLYPMRLTTHTLHHTIPPLPDAPHHTHTPPHYTPFTRCASPHTHSVLNIKPDVKEETEEEKEQKHKTFVEKYEKQIKHFGMLRRWDDSQKYLSDNPHLVCEETANYLVIMCIDLEVEEKHALMEQVAHQTIVMQFILELAKSLKVDPRGCFRQFFSKIKTADQQYQDAFNDELESFKERVRGRAKIRIEKAMKEYEEEEKQKRLGPGGLDPVEVYDTLPKEMQKCFDEKDIQMLQDYISKMDPT